MHHDPSLSSSCPCHAIIFRNRKGKVESSRQGDDVRVGKLQEPAWRITGGERKIHRPAVEVWVEAIGGECCSHCEKDALVTCWE
jgi:hypothetical protein